MRSICVTELTSGAFVLIMGAYQYYRILVDYQILSDKKLVFTRAIHGLCMGMMVFFITAYLSLAVFYIFFDGDLLPYNALISTIFLFGALFVYLIIIVQRDIYRKLNIKTEEIVRTLVNAVEAKDEYTRGHSEHVYRLTALLYDHLPPAQQKKINRKPLLDAAILHDIGKIGVPDSILNKPGRLTDEEMNVIRQHPQLGKHIIENTSFKDLGYMIMYHHERIDENGYYNVPAHDISTEARIIAIADTFSALYSDRCYRPRKSYSDAVEILKRAAGTQLDPYYVDVFCTIPREEIDRVTDDLFQAEREARLASLRA